MATAMSVPNTAIMIEQTHFLKLATWLSPAFPVGGFSYSHGIEYAVEVGMATDAKQAAEWIETILRYGCGVNDSILFRAASRSVRGEGDLAEVVLWGDALRGAREFALESTAQGAAFLKACLGAWPDPAFEPLLPKLGPAPAYPVVVGALTAASGIDEDLALSAYLHAFAANLVSAAVRLAPLGQTDGLIVLNGLTRIIPELTASSKHKTLADFGASAPMLDWAGAKHETQYTRLFRS